MNETVNFAGPGPYELPDTLRASAVPGGEDRVKITLFSQILADDENPGITLKAVTSQMSGQVAKELAAQLVEAAKASDAETN